MMNKLWNAIITNCISLNCFSTNYLAVEMKKIENITAMLQGCLIKNITHIFKSSTFFNSTKKRLIFYGDGSIIIGIYSHIGHILLILLHEMSVFSALYRTTFGKFPVMATKLVWRKK